MKCERARELASEALDGVLTGRLAASFRDHLAGCPPCRAFHAELRETLTLLEELPTVEVGDDFERVVWSRIRAGEPRGEPWHGWARRLAVAWGSFAGGGSMWRWSPVALAASFLLMFLVSSEPPGPAVVSSAAAGAPAPSSPTAALVAEASPEGLRPAAGSGKDTGFEAWGGSGTDAVSGEIPDAVEVYLEQTGRDLRLPVDPDRFRRSNYSYPLRRVRDPAVVPVTGGEAFPIRAGARTPERGVTVITF